MMLAMVVVVAPGARASGAGAVSGTTIVKNAVVAFPGAVNPCTGGVGVVTITYNAAFHFTVLTSGSGAGDFWFTGTITGNFTLVTVSPAAVITGHITMWFGNNTNLNNVASTAIFIAHGTGTDGSIVTLSEVLHFSVSASGMTLSFDKPSFTCG